MKSSEIKRYATLSALALSATGCTMSYETAGILGSVALGVLVFGAIYIRNWYSKQPGVGEYRIREKLRHRQLRKVVHLKKAGIEQKRAASDMVARIEKGEVALDEQHVDVLKDEIHYSELFTHASNKEK